MKPRPRLVHAPALAPALACALACAVLMPPGARAADTLLPLVLDPAASSLTTTLCIQDQCSSDTHPLDGHLVLTLPCDDADSRAGLRDVRFAATARHQVTLDFGFGGRIGAQVENLVIRHAGASVATPFEPWTNSVIVFPMVPTLLAGHVQYQATGLACVVVQLAELPCEDAIDLGTRSTNTISRLETRLTLDGDRATLTGGFRFEEFIQPDEPSLGRIEGTVTFTAHGDLRPHLTLEAANGTRLLRWCRRFDQFTPQQTTALDAPWQPADGTPDDTEDERTLRLPISDTAPTAFYRLIRSTPPASAP
ncbi:MAG: hypothetical protein KF833_16470 [Verrucomicrobiae bacterium]|nr:hypothetical protein [Verrucomicrobiae bacterium]